MSAVPELETERLLLREWRDEDTGPWAELCATGDLVGRTGLYHPPDWPGLELGWTVARPHWGNGYAGEAARAAMGWARSELGADRLISLIDDDNRRSQRVAEKLGMRQEGRAEVREHDLRVYLRGQTP